MTDVATATIPTDASTMIPGSAPARNRVHPCSIADATATTRTGAINGHDGRLRRRNSTTPYTPNGIITQNMAADLLPRPDGGVAGVVVDLRTEWIPQVERSQDARDEHLGHFGQVIRQVVEAILLRGCHQRRLVVVRQGERRLLERRVGLPDAGQVPGADSSSRSRSRRSCHPRGSLRAVTVNLFDIYTPCDHRGKLLGALVVAFGTGVPLEMGSGARLVDLVDVDVVVVAFLRAGELVSRGSAGTEDRCSVSSVSSGRPLWCATWWSCSAQLPAGPCPCGGAHAPTAQERC